MGKSKFRTGERVKGNDKKASFRDRTGVVVEWLPASSEYGVRFDDHQETIEYAMSSWLELHPLATAASTRS